ncbi:PD-(D/E)XK nuclease family protein [Spongiimicrobium sp. 2-473A-2-J]|uniref:PD-(D/E)XK nuclease family protein n=1 Tax=Eudoraea algarum TaxID=3417568 RepID=UPI003D365D46
MRSFLEEVIEEECSQTDSLDRFVFVLPSKRAGIFLRNCIARSAKRTLFSPEIYSIEAFVEKLSGLTYATHTQQLFELYTSYLKTITGEHDNFHDFSKWAQTLLQDFNEIDRYLIDAESIFSNLASIREMEHWGPHAEKTQMMRNYLRFWNQLEALYTTFNTALLQKGVGHQGLVYRQACKQLEGYMGRTRDKRHVFVGFNALNTAETTIIQHMLSASDATIYWDSDPYFINDPIHDAGHFIRKHKSSWAYLKDHPLRGVKETYLSQKNIQIIGVPKLVSQAKYVGNLLNHLKSKNPSSLKNTAVVLADETLLNPLMNAIPQTLEGVNITMGYPLYKTPMAGLFSLFFDLYDHKSPQGWFYRDMLSFLSHPYCQVLLTGEKENTASYLSETIKLRNWSYINREKIASLALGASPLEELLFEGVPPPGLLLDKCLYIIEVLKSKFQQTGQPLELEYLYRFYTLFNQLKEWVAAHSFVNDLKSLHSLYVELLSAETLDFRGEPLQGLQLMGMLESRNLDFETVILTSVNEGILPSGKSNNSFIPFDVKLAFGLPTYKDKDAVYTYHFYRLLQRAKNIYLLYNTEPDVLEGGEKSRLITQLLTDGNRPGDITELIASPEISPIVPSLETVIKDVDLMAQIQKLAGRGFSPTSLSNYIRNPIDFYKQNILKIEDPLEVEEIVAANTFGTIIHNTLEDLYRPLVGTTLTEAGLTNLKPGIEKLVRHHFTSSYTDGDIGRGKNLIAFRVAVRYVENFLDREIEEAKKHHIRILGLEESLEMQFTLPEIDFAVFIRGKLDRVDEMNGVLRIIDYKTGKATSGQVEVVDWEKIITDYDQSKAFQLLCYAFLYANKHPVNSLEAGIISFKNLSAGLLRFATKAAKGSRSKNTTIDKDILQQFQDHLKKLILEICDPKVPFVQKEV